MAKKKPSKFTLDEKKKAVEYIKKGLVGTGRFRDRFNRLSEEDQLKAADRILRRFAKRDKAGAVDWTAFFEGLTKFVKVLIELLGPFIFKT